MSLGNALIDYRNKMQKKPLVTKIAEAPARALENAVLSSEKALSTINRPFKQVEGFWYALGPGLITGASDDDPSGVATYSQTGAKYGLSLLWLAPLTFPLMSVIQEMCARIGMATGRGLAANIRLKYSAKILYVLAAMLFFTNTFNLAADMGAMAEATKLMFPSTNTVVTLVVFAIVSLGLQIFVSYSGYAKVLKYLTFVLLLYIATALTLPNLSWANIFHQTIWPNITWSKDLFIMICAILGTTISPYLFFWQTSQEVEERKQQGHLNLKLRHQSLKKEEVSRMRFDVVAGMFFSNLVMYFIIVTCASVLFPQGIVVESAAQAAEALRPLAGNEAYTLFALGIIGTGLLAVPVLSGSAAYALAESFKWSSGFSKGLKHAYAFYGVIIIAMLLGLLFNLFGFNPIKMLIYSAVLNGILAPVIIYFLVKISADKEIMGKWVNGKFANIVGSLVFVLMSLAAVAAIYSIFI